MTAPTPTQSAILNALRDHAPATAARISELTGLGYSTVTAQLRKLATDGSAQRDDNSAWIAGPQTIQADTSGLPSTGTDHDDQTGSSPRTRQQAAPDAHAEPTNAPVEPAEEPAAAEPDPATSPLGEIPACGPAEGEQPPVTAASASYDAEPAPDGADDSQEPQSCGSSGESSTSRRPYRRSDKPARAKGQLQQEVLAYLNDHPGEVLTPRRIAKDLGASDGAVINACNKLAHNGDIERADTEKAAFVFKTPDRQA